MPLPYAGGSFENQLWDRIRATPDKKERERLAEEVVKLHIKNIWLIGTVGEALQLAIVKNNFRNVPEELIFDHLLRTPRNATPEQFFIAK